MLAHAVNERLDELMEQRRAPYRRTIRPGPPSSGPLAGLVGLLDAAGSAPPERLSPLPPSPPGGPWASMSPSS
jgi:hypothetical protein